MDRLSQAKRLIAQGQDGAAREALTLYLEQHPADALGHNLLSALLTRAGRHAEALGHAERAAAEAPGEPVLLESLGSILALNGRPEEGAAALRRAVELAPQESGLRLSLARVLAQARDLPGAIEASRGGSDPELAAFCAAALNGLGLADEAVRELRRALERWPSDARLLSHLAFTLNYDDSASPAQVLEAHRRYGAAVGAGRTLAAKDPEKKLRIAVLTGDLREHSVMYFAEPLLEGLARAGFELWCLWTGGREDAATSRVKPLFARWRAVRGLDSARVAEEARGADIALDLSGHSEGHALAALARRIAPLQVTYLGYPNTTGVSAVDARIVDALTDPPGAAAVERLVRVEGCFLCYRPPGVAPAVGPARQGPVVFGSFNAMPKLSGATLRLWAGVLRAVPGSRLLIKNQGAEVRAARERVLGELAGVGSGRVEFAPWAGSTREHLGAYAGVDIALDTTPYNGTTTTCEALFMGVPVVSLVGAAHASRVGLSLLTAAGLGALAAADEPKFIGLCAALAADRGALAALRGGLRERVERSALRDEAGFAARFAAALRELWRERCGA